MNILFVCLGNICRSPAAEGVMKKLVLNQDSFFIDSAGLIDVHEGENADYRMRRAAKKRGYELTSKSRMIHQKDFDFFDYIVGMDFSNIRTLKEKCESNENKQKILLMSDFLTQFSHKEIPDPYYGGDADFELVLDLLEDACFHLLKYIKEKEGNATI